MNRLISVLVPIWNSAQEEARKKCPEIDSGGGLDRWRKSSREGSTNSRSRRTRAEALRMSAPALVQRSNTRGFGGLWEGRSACFSQVLS